MKTTIDFKKECLVCDYLNPEAKGRFKCYTNRCPVKNKNLTIEQASSKLKKLNKKIKLIENVLKLILNK